jgi:hypothetical protein
MFASCIFAVSLQARNVAPVFEPNFKALSLFRWALSIYLIGDFFSYSDCCFVDFFTSTGVSPIAALSPDVRSSTSEAAYQILKFLELVSFPTVFPFLYISALIAFGFGYRTRWVNAIIFILHTYLLERSPYIVYGADLIAHLMLLWCFFLPVNRYWSLDAALYSGQLNRPYPVLPLAAIRLQASSTYFFPALTKLAGAPWRGGYALIWALSDNMFGGTAAGLFLVNNMPALLYYVNYAVIAFQLSFPLLVFCPWRNNLTRGVALAVAAAMHVAFIFCLNIGSFPYISLAILLLYVPDAWLDVLLQRRRTELEGITIYYEPGCLFCLKVALLLREFLLDHEVSILPASAKPSVFALLKEKKSWVVLDRDGMPHLKWHGVTFLLMRNRFLVPLAWVMETRLLARLLERLYDGIGRRRGCLGAITKLVLPFHNDPPIGRHLTAICGFLMLLTLASNANSIVRIGEPQEGGALPPSFLDGIDFAARVFQVSQHWYLFAPVPTHYQRKFEILAHLKDGTARDLTLILSKSPFRTHDGTTFEFSHHRWMKYFSKADDFTETEWQALGHYLCRRVRQDSLDLVRSALAIEVILTTHTITHGVDAPTDSDKVLHHSIDCTASRNLDSRYPIVFWLA